MAHVCSTVLVLSAGCGGGGVGLPEGETGSVTGTVTYNGSPVPEGAIVTFASAEGKPTVATGVTDASGKYSLVMRSQPDILAGKYSVGVAAAASESASVESVGTGDGSGGTSPLPEKFASPETSGLTFDVKGGENTIDIQLMD